MFVCCECCALSGRGLCDELITCPEESSRLCCVVCDYKPQEWPALGRSATGGGGDVLVARLVGARNGPKIFREIFENGCFK